MQKISIIIVCMIIISSFVSIFSTEYVIAAPNTPSNPSPSDDSKNISVTRNLSWNSGSPNNNTVKYDVYFGVSNPPGIVYNNQSATSYDPGTMEYLTTYYWKIVAWDNHGASSAGSVWHFTTTTQPNNPPYVPSSPSPSDGQTGVDVNASLSWVGGDPDPGDTVTYDVYFGTSSSPPKVVGNQSGTSYDPGTMGYLTTYYWKIVAWDNHGASSAGSVWHFTTTTQPNNPPYVPSSPSPSDGQTGVDVNASLSWVGGDPDPGDTVTYDVYFGTSNPPGIVVHNQSAVSYDPGTMGYYTMYYWKIVAWDNHDASATGSIWNFTTELKPNQPPYVPSNPSPSDGATNVSTTTDLSWTGGDPDSGDAVTYDVYFGTTSPPTSVIHNQSATSYDPGTMNFLTTYYWKIIAWDNHSANTTSLTWHFTTTKNSSSGGGGDGGGGEPPIPPPNKKPIANLSAGEPYQGFVNSTILFDGSRSYDPDGNITKWFWIFGDNTNGTGETVRHTYSKTGTYWVTLTVTDNKGDIGDDTTICVIKQPNGPLTSPIITGPTDGTKNTIYNYTALSTDRDNTSIQYTFDWGDSVSQSSGFLPNGSVFTVNHSWTAAGRYYVTVTVTNNHTNSSSEKTVYIDTVQTRGVGYLIDNDGDGIYDAFFSDISKLTTTVQRKDGSYLIDSNGDGKWDYTYNATTGIQPYLMSSTIPGFEILFVIVALIFVVFWNHKIRTH